MQHYDGAEPINCRRRRDVRSPSSPSASRRGRLPAAGCASTRRRPDGVPRKTLDGAPLRALGWRRAHSLDDGARRRPTTGSSSTRPEPRRMAEHARIYRSLYRIRRVEEEVARVYPTDKIKSPVHLSIGQEAVSVGVCEALRPRRRRLRHLPRPRALPRQGRRPARDDRRAVRQGDRLRQRQGRLDAPDRHRRRRDGHVGGGRHHDPQRRRLRLRAASCAASDASSSASSATARPRRASSTRASTSPR